MTILALAFLVAGGGCFRRPPISPLDTLPSVRVPASMAKVADGRGRFREIYCAIRADHGFRLPEDRPCEDAIVRLAGEPAPTGRAVTLHGARPLRVLVVPGFLNECFIRWASPFADGLAHLETHGYRTGTLRVSAMSGSAHNARRLRTAIMELDLAPGERLLLVGHSKGAVDVLESLATYPEIVPRVAAVASVAGAIGGSPLADALGSLARRLLRALDVERCAPGDGRAIESLRPAARLAFLAGAALPPSVKYFSVGGIVGADDTSWLLRSGQRHLARIDALNDGQVLASDTIIPGGTLLGFVRADHWAIALPFSRTLPDLAATHLERNAFPREVLLEAIVRAVEERL